MKHSIKRPLGLLMALGLLSAGTAQATTLTAISLDEMSASADAVILGKVSNQEAVRIGNAINTVVTFDVMDSVVGNPGSSVSVLVPGGSIESAGFRIGETNASAPVFIPGGDAVLFLTDSDSEGYRQIVGYSQGRLSINEGMVRVPELNSSMTLEQFKARVQTHATP